ncbi:hypothetical protein BG53_04045 [Paenibacillus darwinianus]|uniref:Uncharacterized protein n=1 Tax=Paenibacillus darwinianus TaxID=1380763 RepID=A0A9W5S0Z9_9BACL|nr:hypothetical protein [Paenibacillus darwinianus]EXX87507.1 hypothetical protein BG53_04045 [Paenibacillus darwinianus]EXX87515.1 hypothetical protein CH50_05245 [Paenibacillus darwinianus]EXX87644.1 hypothetical protein BG52_03710 [Paenibacillus darwinianus]
MRLLSALGWIGKYPHARDADRRTFAFAAEFVGVSEVCAQLGIKDRHARALLKQLTAQGMLLPAKGDQRVHRYQLSAAAAKLFS